MSKVDERVRRRPSPGRDSYRWDEIGGYIVSTIRFSDLVSAANGGARFETLAYSVLTGEWDVDGAGVQSATQVEADVAHDAACDRIRQRIH